MSNQLGCGEEPVCGSCPWICEGWLYTTMLGTLVGDGHQQPHKSGLPPRRGSGPAAGPIPNVPRHPRLRRLAPRAAIASSALENAAGAARTHPRHRASRGTDTLIRRGERGRAESELGERGPPSMRVTRGDIAVPMPPGEQSLQQAALPTLQHGQPEAAHGNHPWGILMRMYLCSCPGKRWIQSDTVFKQELP